ncbi:IMP cyclohydrolase [Deltaproteobacteria bacterium]|nr:IMP cyclohydrolase [Deltaproteobacteria bacterium]
MSFTNIELIKKIAARNFSRHISENVYPGRGIVLGRNHENSWIVIYWIMGRTSNSRNRIFTHEKGILRSEAADSSMVADPSLIIYNAMRDLDEYIVVSNGKHTDTICKGLEDGKSFYTALNSEKHEPDPPNYTPRISGIIQREEESMALSIISKSDFSVEQSEHRFYRCTNTAPGYGYCLTTYLGDGNPLPSFKGDPFMLPLQGNAEQIANFYWQELNQDNRISLAVRELTQTGEDQLKIINRNQVKSEYNQPL